MTDFRYEPRCLPPCGAFDRPHLLDECYADVSTPTEEAASA